MVMVEGRSRLYAFPEMELCQTFLVKNTASFRCMFQSYYKIYNGNRYIILLRYTLSEYHVNSGSPTPWHGGQLISVTHKRHQIIACQCHHPFLKYYIQGHKQERITTRNCIVCYNVLTTMFIIRGVLSLSVISVLDGMSLIH